MLIAPRTITRLRPGTQALDATGYRAVPVYTSASVVADVQPADDNAVLTLPAGDHTRGALLIITQAPDELRAAGPSAVSTAQTLADRVQVDGLLYEVRRVAAPWAAVPGLPVHYEALCVRVRPDEGDGVNP